MVGGLKGERMIFNREVQKELSFSSLEAVFEDEYFFASSKEERHVR